MYCLLNQGLTPVEITGINPNTTVLQWLREHLHLVGTKEGCAAGDCGACTAVVGECTSDGKSVEYKSINTCIALAYSLAGKHLVTVEGLAEAGRLHPVQQAMVDKNGSQCGFCTPGFVMSLFGLYQNETHIDLEKIQHCLSGNLCRCTGYQPIIEAAFGAFSDKQDDYYSKNQSQIASVLSQLKSSGAAYISYDSTGTKQMYLCPQTADELAEAMINHPNARIVAGSTDLGLEITQQFSTLPCLINIKEVEGFRRIVEDDKSIRIYAAVSYEQAWSVLVRNYPALEEFLTRFASKPIRNWATICGNVANASPIGDMPPVLIALDAELSLRQGGCTRSIAIEDFFLDYRKTELQSGEFIESVSFAKLGVNERLLTYKLSKRFEDDISAVCLALKVELDSNRQAVSVRAAFGGMAAVPKRAKALEEALINHWSDTDLYSSLYTAINREFSPITDMRASSQYRIESAVKLVQKAHAELSGGIHLPSVFKQAALIGEQDV